MGGIRKQRPPRPRESGETKGGEEGGLNPAFGNGRGEQEAQAQESGTADLKH